MCKWKEEFVWVWDVLGRGMVTLQCWWLGCWCRNQEAGLSESLLAGNLGRRATASPAPGSHSVWACRWCARHRCASHLWYGCRRASHRVSRWGSSYGAPLWIWRGRRIWAALEVTGTVGWWLTRPGRWHCRHCRWSVAERWSHCQTHSSYSSSTTEMEIRDSNCLFISNHFNSF